MVNATRGDLPPLPYVAPPLMSKDKAPKAASPASPDAAQDSEVQVVAFVGSGSKIGLGIAQAKVGPSIMVSGDFFLNVIVLL